MNYRTAYTYSFSIREESTTETEEAAIAAEPIHGCRTKPIGRKTPREEIAHHCLHISTAT